MRISIIGGRRGYSGSSGGGGGTSVPDSPTMLETTGSLVGQMTVAFWKPSLLQDGNTISTAPVTSTMIYVSSSAANALANIYSYSADAGTSSVTSAITVPAGTWYVWGTSSNSYGTSDMSHVLTVVVT